MFFSSSFDLYQTTEISNSVQHHNSCLSMPVFLEIKEICYFKTDAPFLFYTDWDTHSV